MSNLLTLFLFLFSIAFSHAAIAQYADPIQDLVGIWRVPGETTEITIWDNHTVQHSKLGRGDIQHINADYYNITYRDRDLICRYLARVDSATELSMIRQERLDYPECDLGLMRRAPWREGVPGPAFQIWQQIKDTVDLGLLESFRRQFGSRNPSYEALAAGRIAALKTAVIASEAASQWSIIQNSNSEAVLLDFISKFGDTDYGRYARIRLDELKRERERTASPVSRNEPLYYFVWDTRPPDPWLEMWEYPDGRGRRISQMPNGTPLELIQKGPDKWYKFRNVETGEIGWVAWGNDSGRRVWIYCCRTLNAIPPNPIPYRG